MAVVEDFCGELFGGGGERLSASRSGLRAEASGLGEGHHDGPQGGIDHAAAAAGFVVVVDGFVGSENEMRDVGNDGAATGRDASRGEESVEGDEGVVDLLGFLEMSVFTDEFGGEVDGVIWRGQGHGMADTK